MPIKITIIMYELVYLTASHIVYKPPAARVHAVYEDW